jgi:hypothetical protein
MSLAPICILYCKQCNTINEYNICRFSRFGFLGEKSVGRFTVGSKLFIDGKNNDGKDQ